MYPGVAAALKALGAAGLTLGCVTNKRESYARALLEQAGLAGQLHFVTGGDTFGSRKPDPEGLRHAAERYGASPEECVMVGDSSNDREAARRAGFAFVFAAYGYAQAAEPRLTDGLGTIGSFGELPGLLCPPQTDK